MEAEEEGDCNIRVICRFRPVNKRELAEGGGIAQQLTFPNEKCCEVAAFNGRGAQTFHFDRIFYDTTTTQQDVYELAARKSIDDVIKGYNSTIFAYGQTGAGKSWTMFGDIVVPELKGIIPRSCMHIFDHIARDTQGTEFTIKCSFLEIYKEIVRDLLNPAGSAGKQGLRVREVPGKGVWVEGLHEAYVTCEADVLQLLQQGERHRATSSTSMNASSSRSHSLFILTLHQKTPDGSTKEGRLNLADLAGSEKVGKTGATGETLEEAKKINQSLSALGKSINALTKSKKTHVPYRDSKLTFILRESLGGNCKTTLLVACSPHIFNLEETVSTLMFAKRAKTIKNNVKVNKQRSVAELMAIIEKLKKELMFFKKYISVLEQELEKVNGPNWKQNLPKISSLVLPAKEKAESAPASPHDSEDEDDKFDDAELGKPKAAEPGSLHAASTSNIPETVSSLSVGHQSPPSGHKRAKSDALESHAAPLATDSPMVPNKKKQEEEEDYANYSSSANMSIKVAELQVELQQTREKLRLEIENLTEESKTLTSDNNTLLSKLTKKKQILKEKENALKNFKDQLEDQQRQAEANEEKLKYEIKQLSLRAEDLAQTAANAAAHHVEVKGKLSELAAELEDLKTESERDKREKDRLQREQLELSEQLKHRESRIGELETNVSEYEQDYKNIRDQSLHLESLNKSLQSKIEALESKHQTQTTAQRETESKLRIALTEKQVLESRLVDTQNELASVQLQLLEKRQVLVAAQQTEQALIEAGEEQLEVLRSTTVPLTEYHQLQQDSDKLRETLSQVKDKYNVERENLLKMQQRLEESEILYQEQLESMKYDLESARDAAVERADLLERQLVEADELHKKKLRTLEEKCSSLTSQVEQEKTSRAQAETLLEELRDQAALKDKDLRRLKTTLEDKEHELSNQTSIANSQARSLEAQSERIKQLEKELDDSRKDREILQEEVKTAIEINIENARKFEQQLEAQELIPKIQQHPNIRVPVNQGQAEVSFFDKLFGIKQYPFLREVKPQIKFGYLLAKGSSWYNRWRKRWFVLSDKQRLLYFDSNNQSSRAEQLISLRGCSVATAGDITGKPYTIRLSFGRDKSRDEIFLQAPSEEEHLDWIRYLQLSSNELPKNNNLSIPKQYSNSGPNVSATQSMRDFPKKV